MKKKNLLRRVFNGMLASMIGVLCVPSSDLSQVYAADQCDQGTQDGLDWELWNQNYQGTSKMQLTGNGGFIAEWSGIENYLARTGKKWASNSPTWESVGDIRLSYDADYRPNGNSYLAVYGWTRNSLVEYYIIENFGTWRPPGGQGQVGTITVNGHIYDVYKAMRYNQPSIDGPATFPQYFSVRRDGDKSSKGTIDISEHFKQWEKLGLDMGSQLYEVSLVVEGYQSSGYAEVKQNYITLGGTPLNAKGGQHNDGSISSDPSTPSTPSTPTVEPDANGNYFYDTFESGAGDWVGRGSASVTTNSKNYVAGNKSLYVSGRTDNWNGCEIPLDSSAFVAGGTYSFSTGVLQRSGSAVDMKMTLQYTDSSGTEQYDQVATASAASGTWTKLENTSYTIPSGASNLRLYVEAPDSLTDFYIDEAKGSKEGVKSSVTNGSGTVEEGNSTPPTTPSTSSGDSYVGKFGSLFKVGTSVSPNELNSGASFIKKHFNSITPENELKPDAILDQQACQQRGNNVNTQVNLSRAAQTLKFCEQNGIGVRGHTFVWYSQTPSWFFKENFSDNGAYVSKDIMNQRLESFIKNTFEALKSQYPNLNVYQYDVCNELFLNDGGGLRKTYYTENSGASDWAKVYGENNDEFIVNAFTYARKYAPAGCKLYINDYNEYIPAKTNDIYNMAMKLKELGVIDGIGMQSHLATNYPSAQEYRVGLEKFLSTGLEVSITELDITESSYNSQAQADLYEAVFQMAVDNAAQIPSFTLWGTHDSISWRRENTPLPFGSNYTPKKAFEQIMSIQVNPDPVTTTPVATTTTITTTKKVTTTTTTTTKKITTTTTKKATTTTKPTTTTTAPVKPTMAGDANCDGSINISDAVLIKCYIVNPGKYNIPAQGIANADVIGNGNGINAQDAIAIQKYILRIVTALPIN